MPEVIFNGPEGRLEGRYQQSKKANGPTALVLHPHPLHGGTMNNKVTYALYQTFVSVASLFYASTSAALGDRKGSLIVALAK